jgi:WD40 repeat protein
MWIVESVGQRVEKAIANLKMPAHSVGKICAATIVTAFVLLAALAAPRAEDASPLSREKLSELLASDPVQQVAAYDFVTSRPMSDNGVIVPWLNESTDRLQPMFLYELSRRLFADDRAAALEWYAIALMRARYDAGRCSNTSAGNDVGTLAWRATPVPTYVINHPDERAAAFGRALGRTDLFADQISPMWVCLRGTRPGTGAAPGVKPESEWSRIRERLRQQGAQLADTSFGQPDKIVADRAILTLRQPGEAHAVVWSIDDTMLAVTSFVPSHTTLWDARNGALIRQMTGGNALKGPAAFTRDGKYLVTAAITQGAGRAHDSLTIWDVGTGEIAHTLAWPVQDRPSRIPDVLAIDPTGRLVATAVGGIVAFYDTAAWKPIGTILVANNAVTAIAFSPDGARLAVGHIGGEIDLFDVQTRVVVRTIDAYSKDSAGVESLAYSPDGQLLASGPTISFRSRQGSDGKFYDRPIVDPLRIWELTDGTLVHSYSLSREVVNGLAFSPDGKQLASAARDHTVRLWDITAPDRSETLVSFTEAANAVAFSHDGKRLAVTGGDAVVVIDIDR